MCTSPSREPLASGCPMNRCYGPPATTPGPEVRGWWGWLLKVLSPPVLRSLVSALPFLCNFLIKGILCSEAVLLSTEIETCNKDGRKLFMSALFEEAVVCNYRRFSSLVAKTTNKCSCVTWRGVTEKPLLVSLFVCVGDHMTSVSLSLLVSQSIKCI